VAPVSKLQPPPQSLIQAENNRLRIAKVKVVNHNLLPAASIKQAVNHTTTHHTILIQKMQTGRL
jgi:hypothetical protein